MCGPKSQKRPREAFLMCSCYSGCPQQSLSPKQNQTFVDQSPACTASPQPKWEIMELMFLLLKYFFGGPFILWSWLKNLLSYSDTKCSVSLLPLIDGWQLGKLCPSHSHGKKATRWRRGYRSARFIFVPRCMAPLSRKASGNKWIFRRNEKYGTRGTSMSTSDTWEELCFMYSTLHVFTPVFCTNITVCPEDWPSCFWTLLAWARRLAWPPFHSRTWLEKQFTAYVIMCPWWKDAQTSLLPSMVEEKLEHHCILNSSRIFFF